MTGNVVGRRSDGDIGDGEFRHLLRRNLGDDVKLLDLVGSDGNVDRRVGDCLFGDLIVDVVRGPGLEHLELCDRNVVVFVGGKVQVDRSVGNRTTSCPPSPKSAPRTSNPSTQTRPTTQCCLFGDLIVRVVLGPGLEQLEFCDGNV